MNERNRRKIAVELQLGGLLDVGMMPEKVFHGRILIIIVGLNNISVTNEA